jgi:hypothetical protein
MITTRFAMLRIWEILLCERNHNMFFKSGLALMEIHGRVAKPVSKNLR